MVPIPPKTFGEVAADFADDAGSAVQPLCDEGDVGDAAAQHHEGVGSAGQ